MQSLLAEYENVEEISFHIDDKVSEHLAFRCVKTYMPLTIKEFQAAYQKVSQDVLAAFGHHKMVYIKRNSFRIQNF